MIFLDIARDFSHSNIMLHIALYQPDIAQNAGTIMRMCACLNIHAHIIEPAGFPASSSHFKRAGMDYLDLVNYTRHDDFEAFNAWRITKTSRLLLLTTKSAESYLDFSFKDNDILLLGRESAGVPQSVHESVDARLTIKMSGEARSMNVALSAAMVAGEAMRQLDV
jgi:tRNA (cytidine/uridine-2'-O-)-methyltransferase